MPLVPPARRNWDREEVLKLEGTIISWPPHGWIKMSSDQRKLTWEFAATTLELKTVSFNAINRTDLLYPSMWRPTDGSALYFQDFFPIPVSTGGRYQRHRTELENLTGALLNCNYVSNGLFF
jgi:hypothetical protein